MRPDFCSTKGPLVPIERTDGKWQTLDIGKNKDRRDRPVILSEVYLAPKVIKEIVANAALRVPLDTPVLKGLQVQLLKRSVRHVTLLRFKQMFLLIKQFSRSHLAIIPLIK
jgi:hypothetical protein